MQTDPNDVLRGLQILQSSQNPTKTYVKGLRRGRPIADQVFTIGMSFFESLMLKVRSGRSTLNPIYFQGSCLLNGMILQKTFHLIYITITWQSRLDTKYADSTSILRNVSTDIPTGILTGERSLNSLSVQLFSPSS